MDSPENASDKLNTSNSTESVSDKHNGSNSAPANLATDSSSDANQFHSPVKTKDDVVLSDDSPVKEKDDDSFVKQKDDPAASDVTSASASDSTKTADSQKKSDRSSNNKIRKEDLVYAQNLGRGSYSKVTLASHVTTGVQYAVKIVSKMQIISENKVQYVMNEKNILKSLNHPNIIKLISTFQTPDELHYVLEYAEGGELLEYIKKMGRFDYSTSMRVSAELVNALGYLRSKNVVHRDIKPENILFDKHYHIKLVDFGTALVSTEEPKPLEENRRNSSDSEYSPEDENGPQRRLSKSRDISKSFCGTAQYASPELLSNCTTTYSSDLWALGCVIYQMVTGKRPFQDTSDYLTFKRILDRDVRYPPDFPPDARDLCDQLLVLNPCNRLGVGPGGHDCLQAHPFFANADFPTLTTRATEFSWKACAPRWVEDAAAQACYDCEGLFSFWIRKHHCRHCGNIFCSRCSSHSSEIPHIGYLQPVRVCTQCFGVVRRRIANDKKEAA